LEIKGAYDNVLIDILCRELKKEGIPIPLVFLLGDIMWKKHLYFFDGQDVAFMRTSYKGLSQGSVLSPFMYNFYTRLVEACWHPLCAILQYVVDLVMYILEKMLSSPCLQTSLTTQVTSFGDKSGNMKIPRFQCGSVRLHFEMSLNLNIWGIMFDRKLT
jgi:hypothetical protein